MYVTISVCWFTGVAHLEKITEERFWEIIKQTKVPPKYTIDEIAGSKAIMDGVICVLT